MKLTSRSLDDGRAIDPRYAFGRMAPPEDGHMALSDNLNPQLSWSEVPEGTRSFALLVCDPDVPTDPALVNREDVPIPRDLERCDFYHWVLVDLPADCREIAEGAWSSSVISGGKAAGAGPAGSRQGLNDYTGFMAGSEMAGQYFGYDGPCPPWNDERLHHYHFTLYALDIDRVPVNGDFDGRQVSEAIEGHVLAQASVSGTYTLNPSVT